MRFLDGFRPVPFEKIPGKVLRAARGFFEMHLLASHGDHFVHPLDEPVEPVTSFPGQIGNVIALPRSAARELHPSFEWPEPPEAA